MTTITTRTDLKNWIDDRYADEPPTEADVDRILGHLETQGFRWGKDIDQYDVPDSVFYAPQNDQNLMTYTCYECGNEYRGPIDAHEIHVCPECYAKEA